MTPERIARLRQVLAMRQPDLTVVTDFVHKQRNLSVIVRNCDAVGIMRVHTVLGEEEYRGAFRGTKMGSHRWVDVRRRETVEQALLPLRQQGCQVVAAHLSADAVDFRSVDYTRPTAILLGAERCGVSLEGETDDPGGWYATVRAETAALYASASGGEGVPGVLASTPGQGTVRKD
jgi:tRNA (guanosine-2'-O-)-methyltransferase